MKNYISEFLEIFDYPVKAREALVDVYSVIMEDNEARETWENMMNEYIADMQCDFYQQLKWCERFAKRSSVHEFTLQLLLFICHSKQMRVFYAEKGIDDRFWFDTAGELKVKLFECYEVYGVWGTFVPTAFNRTFHLRSYVLGRLRFDPDKFGSKYEKNGIVLNEESTVIMVHIPRTGTPLDPVACEQAYRDAAKIYAPILNGAPCIFACHSWLLFPENRSMLSEKSNILAFMDTYDLVEFGYHGGDHPDLWRLFDTMERNPDRLPADSSLRRGYIELLRRGGKTGWGYGVYCPEFN